MARCAPDCRREQEQAPRFLLPDCDGGPARPQGLRPIRRRPEVTTGGNRLSCRWIARARSSSSSTECAWGTPAATIPPRRHARRRIPRNRDPSCRARRADSSGESRGPISVPLALISAPSLRLSDQPSGVSCDSKKPSAVATIRRLPSALGSGSYSSAAVLIAGPRFSADQWPAASRRARQISLPPRPPGRLDPK